MPLRPDPERARAALARLHALREVVADVEEDVLACLVVTGEPLAQRVLDDWLDQVADTLRAVGETADEVATALAAQVPPSTSDASHDPTTSGTSGTSGTSATPRRIARPAVDPAREVDR